MIEKRVKRDSRYHMCRVEHQHLKQESALGKAEQSKARKLSNENIVYKAKQTSKFSYKGFPSNSKSSWFSVWAKRIKPKWGKHACRAREPSKSSYISKVKLAHEQSKQIKANQGGK